MPEERYDLTQVPPNMSRLPEYERDEAWIRDFLQRAPIGHVASRWDDQPFIVQPSR